MNGYIKLFRQLKDWEWYRDSNVKCLFLHCLLTANFKDKKWQGKLIKRGQFITSLSHLAQDTGLSVRNVRTAIEKLEKTGEIVKESTSTFTLITVCNFDSYQSLEDNTDTVPTSDRQGSDTVPTSDRQQLKNEKKDKNEENEKKKHIYLGEFQKIKNGETTSRTNLDKNFHFGLFEKHWSEGFQDSILGMWRYLESNENKPIYWGKIGTLTSQLSVIKSSLNQYSEQEIIKAFEDCKFASTKSWPMYLKKAEEQKPDISNYTPPYKIPDFGGDKEKRQKYFYWRLTEYHLAGLLDERLWNIEHRPRAKRQKDAENVCYELEQQNPELAKIELG